MGTLVGEPVGLGDGSPEGLRVGELVGFRDGEEDGLSVGPSVLLHSCPILLPYEKIHTNEPEGLPLGEFDGAKEGSLLGETLGEFEGELVGKSATRAHMQET